MTGRVALLPPYPCTAGNPDISVADVVQTTYGAINPDVDLAKVTVQGTLLLTKIIMVRDTSKNTVQNWYYNATIELSCDSTLQTLPLTSIDVTYRGAGQPVGVDSGRVQKWFREVLKKLGDDVEKAESAKSSLFEMVWPSVLKWFGLALERCRLAVTRAHKARVGTSQA